MPIKSGIITMDTLYVNFLRTGLQLAYFFHQANRDYTVYERHDMAGWSRNNEYIHYALSYCIPYRKVRASVLIEHCTFMHTLSNNSQCTGSFFTRYPRHRTLISINKRFTGSTNHEFNLRHDWNSLISNNRSLELRHYSKEYFPAADTYVRPKEGC